MHKIFKVIFLSATMMGGIITAATTTLASHITVNPAFERLFQCPHSIPFADLDVIYEKGKEYNGYLYVPVNKEEFYNNLPGRHNIITTRLDPPLLEERLFFINDEYKVMRECHYKYYTLFSSISTLISSFLGGDKERKGFRLAIMTDTRHWLNKLTIHNASPHPIHVTFVRTDQDKPVEGKKGKTLALNANETKHFNITSDLRSFSLQIQDSGVPQNKGSVDEITHCPIQEAGGEFNITYSGDTCTVNKQNHGQ